MLAWLSVAAGVTQIAARITVAHQQTCPKHDNMLMSVKGAHSQWSPSMQVSVEPAAQRF